MPSKEIKELRQSGRLEEALTVAQAELEAKPDNIWGKRNISWVYYEYLKKHAHDFSYDDFIENLTKLKDLNLPENEVMVFDTAAWQIASVVFSLQRLESVDYSKIDVIFDLIKEYHFTKPSESYSLLYKSFHKGYHNWSGYLQFADWWNFDNFRPEDYQKEEYNDRQIMALAEQAYIAYAKALIEGEALDAYGDQRRIDTDKIKVFLPKLDTIIDNHPEYQYPPYFKAKLLLVLGDEDNVLQAFLPFAKQKRNDFWVWELMAEIFANDNALQFACYCKALSLKTPEDFLVKTRRKFAELLIKEQRYQEARTEIEKIIKVREQHGWKISNQLSQWIQSDWYLNAEASSNNKQLYSKHLSKADEILFQDIPEEKVVVEFVNKDKKMLNFIKSKSYHGFFNFKGISIKPAIGDLLSVRLQAVGTDGFYKVLTIKRSSESEIENLDAIKKVKGDLRRNIDQSFGFLGDVFVSPEIITKNRLKNDDNIKGLALMSFNKKKNEWGWRLIKIY
jgi:uncharacterized protein DUF7017/TOTE conflict system protein, potentially ssRNA-binding